MLSCIRLFAIQWTIAYQAPPSLGFSRQACCSGLPFSSPGDLPNPGIKPGSSALQADALPSEPLGKPYDILLPSNIEDIIFALPKQNIFLLNLQIAVCLWWKLKICVPQNFSVKQNVSYICVCHRTVMISDMFLCIRVSLFAQWRWCRSLTIPLLLLLLLNHFSHVRLFVIPWIAAYQAPPSMGFSRQEYWSGLPLPSLNKFTRLLQTSRRSFMCLFLEISKTLWKMSLCW